VRISVNPHDAVVTLDGNVLSARPFVAALPRDSAEHELTAIAEGCRDLKQTVHLNSDVALLVAMKCQRRDLFLEPRRAKKATAATPSAAPSSTAASVESSAAPSAAPDTTPGAEPPDVPAPR
jgi:hypothetical protein